jgi:hypothetical protein
VYKGFKVQVDKMVGRVLVVLRVRLVLRDLLV